MISIDELNVIPNFNFEYIGPQNFSFEGFNNIENAEENQITFCSKSGKKGFELLTRTKSNIILIKHSLYEEAKSINKNFILCENPRLSFIKILNQFFLPDKPKGIHETAIIDDSSEIGEGCYIGKYVTIGKNVKIGKNTIIHDKVTIYDNIEIGDSCIIHASTVLGADGFGYERYDNEIVKFPHFGKIIIGNEVEIGANTCIDRGTLSNTIIEDQVKIDNLVHVGHNVLIKKNSFLIANSMIGGSTIIEENSWIAPSASLMNGIVFGHDSLAGMGSVVLRSVKPNKTVFGVPAKELIKKK